MNRRRDLRWVQYGVTVAMIALAAAAGAGISRRTDVTTGVGVGCAVVLAFLFGLIWAAADVAMDDTPAPPGF